MKSNKYICLAAACLIVVSAPLNTYAAQEDLDYTLPAQDKISLDLKNVEISELLRIVSVKTGKTIVPSKDITGRITIYLTNISFNDVLDIIVLTQGLALYQKENIYYIMSEAEYKKMFGQDYIDQRKVETVKLSYAKPSVVFNALGQLKSDVGKIVVDETTGTIILIDIPEKLALLKKAIRDLDRPLLTAIYDLNYAKAADAKSQLAAAVTPGTGEVIIDERNGKAIISDLPQKMQRMSMLVRELDEKSRQVYIEADIVELTLSDKFERGIDWEKVFTSATQVTLAGYFPSSTLSALGAAAYQRISVGTLATDHYDAVLNLLDTYGTTKVISQPRIAVLNNEEANVMVGVRDAYITQTQSQATSTTVTSESVEFIDVGVKLKIIPRIGTDGFITMKLKPEVSSVKETITTDLGSRIPIVQTSQSETTVKVKDGMMIMIAGMTKTEETDTIKGWPVLSKIPFLGMLFGNRDKEVTRTEVIIFLTPHLTRGDEDLHGDDLTKILSKEYLPANLQRKVDRDKQIDNELFDYEGKTVLPPEAGAQVKKAAPQKPLKPAVGEKPDKPLIPETMDLSRLNENARDYYQKGLRAQSDADVDEAKRDFLKATQMDDKLAPAFNSLGIIYEQQGEFNKAEEMYLKASAADTNYASAYSNLALLNENKKDYAKALEYWRKRVSYGDPNDTWTKKALKRIKELESKN